MTAKMNISVPGETWGGVHADWHPAPYGTMSYAFDFLPAPAERFFTVFNHYPPAFEYARGYLDQDAYLYFREGSFGPYKWDFLNGLTVGPAYRENQIEAAAERLAAHTRLGLDSGFFGGSISHAHFMQHLGDQEWRDLLRRADALLSRHRYEAVSYDQVADYARGKVTTGVTAARRSGADAVVELQGETAVPLRLYVLHGDEPTEARYETVEPFSGRVSLSFAT
jgi:hypothetical protein